MVDELFGVAADLMDFLWTFGRGSVIAWVLRILGVVSFTFGLLLWPVLGMSFLYVPAVLLAVGLVSFVLSLVLAIP